MFGFFHVGEKNGKVNDSGSVGISEFDAPLGLVCLGHGNQRVQECAMRNRLDGIRFRGSNHGGERCVNPVLSVFGLRSLRNRQESKARQRIH